MATASVEPPEKTDFDPNQYFGLTCPVCKKSLGGENNAYFSGQPGYPLMTQSYKLYQKESEIRRKKIEEEWNYRTQKKTDAEAVVASTCGELFHKSCLIKFCSCSFKNKKISQQLNLHKRKDKSKEKVSAEKPKCPRCSRPIMYSLHREIDIDAHRIKGGSKFEKELVRTEIMNKELLEQYEKASQTLEQTEKDLEQANFQLEQTKKTQGEMYKLLPADKIVIKEKIKVNKKRKREQRSMEAYIAKTQKVIEYMQNETPTVMRMYLKQVQARPLDEIISCTPIPPMLIPYLDKISDDEYCLFALSQILKPGPYPGARFDSNSLITGILNKVNPSLKQKLSTRAKETSNTDIQKVYDDLYPDHQSLKIFKNYQELAESLEKKQSITISNDSNSNNVNTDDLDITIMYLMDEDEEEHPNVKEKDKNISDSQTKLDLGQKDTLASSNIPTSDDSESEESIYEGNYSTLSADQDLESKDQNDKKGNSKESVNVLKKSKVIISSQSSITAIFSELDEEEYSNEKVEKLKLKERKKIAKIKTAKIKTDEETSESSEEEDSSDSELEEWETETGGETDERDAVGDVTEDEMNEALISTKTKKFLKATVNKNMTKVESVPSSETTFNNINNNNLLKSIQEEEPSNAMMESLGDFTKDQLHALQYLVMQNEVQPICPRFEDIISSLYPEPEFLSDESMDKIKDFEATNNIDPINESIPIPIVPESLPNSAFVDDDDDDDFEFTPSGNPLCTVFRENSSTKQSETGFLDFLPSKTSLTSLSTIQSNQSVFITCLNPTLSQVPISKLPKMVAYGRTKKNNVIRKVPIPTFGFPPYSPIHRSWNEPMNDEAFTVSFPARDYDPTTIEGYDPETIETYDRGTNEEDPDTETPSIHSNQTQLSQTTSIQLRSPSVSQPYGLIVQQRFPHFAALQSNMQRHILDSQSQNSQSLNNIEMSYGVNSLLFQSGQIAEAEANAVTYNNRMNFPNPNPLSISNSYQTDVASSLRHSLSNSIPGSELPSIHSMILSNVEMGRQSLFPESSAPRIPTDPDPANLVDSIKFAIECEKNLIKAKNKKKSLKRRVKLETKVAGNQSIISPFFEASEAKKNNDQEIQEQITKLCYQIGPPTPRFINKKENTKQSVNITKKSPKIDGSKVSTSLGSRSSSKTKSIQNNFSSPPSPRVARTEMPKKKPSPTKIPGLISRSIRSLHKLLTPRSKNITASQVQPQPQNPKQQTIKSIISKTSLPGSFVVGNPPTTTSQSGGGKKSGGRGTKRLRSRSKQIPWDSSIFTGSGRK